MGRRAPDGGPCVGRRIKWREPKPMTTTSRVKVDTTAFKRAGVTKAKEMRAALDDAVLYLAASARKRLVEAASTPWRR